MYIIPAIDIIDGKCVRLSQGAYDHKTIYADDPVEVALRYEGHGLSRLHLVDLDGAKAKHVVNWKVLEKIAHRTTLHIDFGGGVKSEEDLHVVFESGAQQATAGSIAATSPETVGLWLERYGSERIILGADLKDGYVATHGWQKKSEYEWKEFITMHSERGAKYVICTDVAKDGMLAGPAVELYQEILNQFDDLKLIASGGVSSIEDLEALSAQGCYGAIVGKAIYEERVTLDQLKAIEDAG